MTHFFNVHPGFYLISYFPHSLHLRLVPSAQAEARTACGATLCRARGGAGCTAGFRAWHAAMGGRAELP
jgi:hypothetical protein